MLIYKLFFTIKVQTPLSASHLAGVCGATGWQQLPLARARQHSSAHCLQESLLLGFLALGVFHSHEGHRRAAVEESLLGCSLAQSWSSAGRAAGKSQGQVSRGAGTQQSIPHHSCCQGLQGLLWGLGLAQLSLHHTPFGSGDTWVHPVWLQEKLQGTHCTLPLPPRACFCGQNWMKMRMQIS